MEKFTEGEALKHGEKIRDCNRKYLWELRLLLMEAYNRVDLKDLGFESFDKYLRSLSTENNKIDPRWMRRQLHAGQIEYDLFGGEHVGEMPEAVLRVLAENVDQEHRRSVYALASDSIKKGRQYPTARQLIQAAKQRNVYKQQTAKLKTENKNTEGREKTAAVKRQTESACDMSGNNTTLSMAATVERSKGNEASEPVPSIVIDLEEQLYAEIGHKLLDQLGVVDVGILANVLIGAMNKSITTTYKEISSNHQKKDYMKIAKGIENALANNKPRKVPVTYKRSSNRSAHLKSPDAAQIDQS